MFVAALFLIYKKKTSPSPKSKQMTPEELQSVFVKAVLFYCNVTNSDPVRYFGFDPSQLSPVIGELDFMGSDYYVKEWLLSYTKPTNAMLEALSFLDVLNFYEAAYANPQSVINTQPYEKLTASQIAAMETTELPQDATVTNTTLNRNVRLRGSSWVVGNAQPTTCFHHIGVESNVSFGSGEVRSVPMTVTSKIDADISVNASTGTATFNGENPQELDIQYILSVAPTSAANSGVLQTFVNINENKTSIPSTQTRQSVNWESSSSIYRTPVVVRDVISCSPGDTIALGCFLSSGLAQTLNFYDVSCVIRGI